MVPWLALLPPQEQAVLRGQSWTGPETPLGGRKPPPPGLSGREALTGPGEGEECPAPATCYFGSISGRERREKGKVRGCDDRAGKGEGRETPARGVETEGGTGRRRDWAAGTACSRVRPETPQPWAPRGVTVFQDRRKELVQLSSRSVKVHKTRNHLLHRLGCFGSQVAGNPAPASSRSTCDLSKRAPERAVQQLRDVPFPRNSQSFSFRL